MVLYLVPRVHGHLPWNPSTHIKIRAPFLGWLLAKDPKKGKRAPLVCQASHTHMSHRKTSGGGGTRHGRRDPACLRRCCRRESRRYARWSTSRGRKHPSRTRSCHSQSRHQNLPFLKFHWSQKRSYLVHEKRSYLVHEPLSLHPRKG